MVVSTLDFHWRDRKSNLCRGNDMSTKKWVSSLHLFRSIVLPVSLYVPEQAFINEIYLTKHFTFCIFVIVVRLHAFVVDLKPLPSWI